MTPSLVTHKTDTLVMVDLQPITIILQGIQDKGPHIIQEWADKGVKVILPIILQDKDLLVKMVHMVEDLQGAQELILATIIPHLKGALQALVGEVDMRTTVDLDLGVDLLGVTRITGGVGVGDHLGLLDRDFHPDLRQLQHLALLLVGLLVVSLPHHSPSPVLLITPRNPGLLPLPHLVLLVGQVDPLFLALL